MPDSTPQSEKPAPAKPGEKGAEGNVYAPSIFHIPPEIEVVEVVDDEGSTKELDSNRSQYVNRKDASGAECGRRIRLKARYVVDQGKQTEPLAGEKIYWCAYPGPDNRTGLISELRAGFDSAGTGTLEKEVTTGADGWTPIVDFYVSQYGGDTFQLVASDEELPSNPKPPRRVPPNAEAAGMYEVWRELAYELDCMERPSGGTYADRANTGRMEGILEDVFIKLRQVGKDDSLSHQHVIKTSEAEKKFGGKFRHGGRWHRNKIYNQIVFCDIIVNDGVHQQGINVQSNPKKMKFELKKGESEIEVPAPENIIDPRDWLYTAGFHQEGMGEIYGKKTYKDLDSRHFTFSDDGVISGGNGNYLLNIDFPDAYDPSKKAHLKMTIKDWSEAKVSGAKIPNTPLSLIGVRDFEWKYENEKDINTNIVNATVHEIGHNLGLAATKLPDGSSSDTVYEDGGHHCSNYFKDYKNKYSPNMTCIMYERHGDHMILSFCDNCADALRARDLSSLPIGSTDSYK